MRFPITVPVVPGMGKHRRTHAQLPKSKKQWLHVIRRNEIETCDIGNLTTTFGPKAPADFLKRHCGRVIFAIEGYDDEPEELFEIENVRTFLSHVTHACPFWTFFASTSVPFLQVVALAVCPRLNVVRIPGMVAIQMNQDHFSIFFDTCLPATAWLHHKAGISPKDGHRQLQRVATYLGMSP